MRCWVLLLLLVSLFQVQLSFAVVGERMSTIMSDVVAVVGYNDDNSLCLGMEKSDSAAEESTYIVSLKVRRCDH